MVWVEASYPAIETLSDWIWIHSPLVPLERSDFSTDAEPSAVGDELLDSAEHPMSKRLHTLEIITYVFKLFMVGFYLGEVGRLRRN